MRSRSRSPRWRTTCSTVSPRAGSPPRPCRRCAVPKCGRAWAWSRSPPDPSPVRLVHCRLDDAQRVRSGNESVGTPPRADELELHDVATGHTAAADLVERPLDVLEIDDLGHALQVGGLQVVGDAGPHFPATLDGRPGGVDAEEGDAPQDEW